MNPQVDQKESKTQNKEAIDQFTSNVPNKVIMSRAEGSTSTSGYTVS